MDLLLEFLLGLDESLFYSLNVWFVLGFWSIFFVYEIFDLLFLVVHFAQFQDSLSNGETQMFLSLIISNFGVNATDSHLKLDFVISLK